VEEGYLSLVRSEGGHTQLKRGKSRNEPLPQLTAVLPTPHHTHAHFHNDTTLHTITETGSVSPLYIRSSGCVGGSPGVGGARVEGEVPTNDRSGHSPGQAKVARIVRVGVG
jgi:hypothetical protein